MRWCHRRRTNRPRRQGHSRSRPPRRGARHGRVRMGRRAGRGVSARPDARAGVSAEQHRRRPADGDGARRRPGEHGRGVVGADHADARRHIRRQSAQPKRAARTDPPEKHHRQPGRQAIPQRGRRIQLDGGPVPPPRSTPRLHQRSGVDRLRLAAPQALRLPRRRRRTSRARLVLASRRTWPNWATRRASTPTAWPARWRRGTTTSPHENDPDFGRGSSAYDGYWGDDKAHDHGGQDARPDRHGAVLRGAGDGGRDGHQGRTAHRPRRPRDARQRQSDPRAVRRGQRDGRVRPGRPTAALAERSAPQWFSATAPGITAATGRSVS